MEREGLPAAAATSTQHAAAMGRVTWHCCVWALATLGARLALARRPYGDALRAVGSMHAVVALMNVLAAGSSVALLVAAFAGARLLACAALRLQVVAAPVHRVPALACPRRANTHLVR